MTEQIFQHYKAEERRFIERCLDWISRVEETYSVITTPFLNPREAEILSALSNRRALCLYSSRSLAETETVKIIMAPEFYVLDSDDFDLALLEVTYASKFIQLTHAQVLGTFLGQTGIKRQELGDIIVTEEKIQVFVSKHLVELFKAIEKIGRAAVKIKEISLAELAKPTDRAVSEVVLVDNLRLDKLIAVAFKISRNLASNMLESNKVKINYLEIDKKDFSVSTDDLISVRGYGRFKVGPVLGQTKKGKQRVELEITKNNKK